MKKSGFLALTLMLAVMLGAGCASRHPLPPLPTVAPSAVPKFDLPEDPDAQGYRVDPEPLRCKEHRIAQNINLENVHWLDGRHLIANLRADEKGEYSRDHRREKRALQIVRVDAHTGEVSPTPYEGRIDCRAADRLITSNTSGRAETWTTFYGRYGEPLQSRPGRTPDGFLFNRISCLFVPEDTLPKYLSDGRRRDYSVQLRVEHGSLLVVRGAPLSADSSEFTSQLRSLMRQPFMNTMDVVSWNEKWYLVKPDGQELVIPNNPGEAAGQYNHVSYVAYRDAYFIPPYFGGRPFDPDELRHVPRFARLLYPDGRVERFGIPDLIWQPFQRKELGYYAYYSRLGLLWRVVGGPYYRNYRGPLAPGFYLQDPVAKTPRPMPDLRPAGDNVLVDDPQWDGCWVQSRLEIVQRRPHYLFNFYYINLCPGEKP